MLWQLLLKDFRCLCRRSEKVVATFGFALLLVVVASFSFRQIGYGQAQMLDLTAGILCLVFLFCGVLGLNQSFAFEHENSALRGLILSGFKPEQLYFSKFIVTFLFLLAVQLFVILCHGLLFGAEIFSYFLQLVFVTAMTAVGFTALGTLLAAIAAAVNGKDILLPLLLFPLSIPLLAAAVFVTRELLHGSGIEFMNFWFVLICAFDVISLALSWVLFEYVVRE